MDSSLEQQTGPQTPKTPWQTRLATFASVVCPTVALLLVLETTFQWDLVDILTPFVEPGLKGFLWLLFCATSMLAFYVLLCARGAGVVRRLLPMAATIIALILLLTVDFTALILDLDFKTNLANREKCVAEFLNHVENNSEMAALPAKFAHLSKGGGEVMIVAQGKEREFLFFTYRGVLDNFSGFLYRSDSQEPTTGKLTGQYGHVKKLRDHWYFVANW